MEISTFLSTVMHSSYFVSCLQFSERGAAARRIGYLTSTPSKSPHCFYFMVELRAIIQMPSPWYSTPHRQLLGALCLCVMERIEKKITSPLIVCTFKWIV